MERATSPSGEVDLRDISTILNALLRFWDRSVELRGTDTDDSSAMSLEMVIGTRLGWSYNTTQQTRTVMFLVTSSIAQMTRSMAALFDVSDRYGLTFGHVPLARSIYDGVGQVQWLLADDDELTAFEGALLTVEESEALCRRRTARALITTKANWEPCLRDARYQGDEEMEARSVEALAELEPLMSEVGTLGVVRPGFAAFAERGWKLAWWPQEVNGHLYGYVSAISHHNLYPLASTLLPGVSNGQNVLHVSPLVDEVFAGGLFVSYAVIRLIELVFTYAGWPVDGLQEIWPLITAAHRLVKD
jgi:hypothetical protein